MLQRARFALNLTLALIALLCVGSPLLFGQTAERKLASDALNIIKPSLEFGETHQGPVDLPIVAANPDLRWTPSTAPETDTLFEKAKNVTFRGPVYCLEFAFKPVRTMEMELATSQGMQRKLVYYLLYRVTYLGNDYEPVVEKDSFDNAVYGKPESVSAKWVRFMPNFIFESKGLKSAIRENQSMLDKVIPAAVRRIAAEERVSTLFDSLTIQTQKIELGQSLWGVATWIDVDPNTDFFAIVVKGLTNAQRIELEGEQFKYTQKSLVLNFFRPGDTIDLKNDVIQYGVPAINRIAGLRDELATVLANRDPNSKNPEKSFDFELTVTGGLEGDGKGSSHSQVLAVAETIVQLGAKDVKTFSQTGTVLFSLPKGNGQEKNIQEVISRQLGLKVDVVDRANRLSEVIQMAEQAQDEVRQNYILQQYGLKERLDHIWVYR
jgi:hypothetical protein